jgi:hypothetical protein
VLLETLRALRAGPPPRRDLIALFSDGEEDGLLGADAFLEGHPWAKEVALVLNFEARGTRGPALMFETGPDNRRLIQRFAAAAPHPVASSYSYEVYRRLPNDTDFTVFRRAGIGGFNFAHIHGATGYHTARDSLERLDPASLQHHGANALALARAFAVDDTAPADRDAGPRAGGDAVYFNPLGWSFVWFPASWVPVLAAAVALAGLAVLGLALARRRIGAGQLAAGLGAWVVALAVVSLAALLLRRPIFPVGYDFRIWGDGSSLAWSLLGVVLLALGLTAGLYLAARRLVSEAALAAAGVALWLVLTVAVSLTAPGASYLFLIPLAAQLPALASRMRAVPAADGGPEAGVPPVLWGLAAAAGVVAALLWAPTLALVAVGLQQGALVVVAALSALLVALLSLQLGLLTAPRSGWLLPAALAAAGIALVVAVRAASSFGPDNPRPTSLVYALDAGTGEARWASFEASPSAWTLRALPGEPRRESLEPFLGHDRELRVGPAPVLDLPAPTVTRLGTEAAADGGRRFHLRVVPPPGAHRLRFLLSPAEQLRSATVAGREAILPEGRETASLLFSAPPAEGVDLVLETRGAEPLTMAAVAQWHRLPAEAEDGPGRRGAELMTADWPSDADTIMVRTELVLDAAATEELASAAETP